eukprot:scaffold100774_cov30-Tisochrysis_lutea.AAC.1
MAQAMQRGEAGVCRHRLIYTPDRYPCFTDRVDRECSRLIAHALGLKTLALGPQPQHQAQRVSARFNREKTASLARELEAADQHPARRALPAVCGCVAHVAYKAAERLHARVWARALFCGREDTERLECSR